MPSLVLISFSLSSSTVGLARLLGFSLTELLFLLDILDNAGEKRRWHQIKRERQQSNNSNFIACRAGNRTKVVITWNKLCVSPSLGIISGCVSHFKRVGFRRRFKSSRFTFISNGRAIYSCGVRIQKARSPALNVGTQRKTWAVKRNTRGTVASIAFNF